MKCIKFYRPHGGHVVRVTDDEAQREVAAGRAMYCPKHWLRAARIKEVTEATS